MSKKNRAPQVGGLQPSSVHVLEEDAPTRLLGPRAVDTTPLTSPGYSSLPVGALLHERRYEIKSVITSQQRINVYQAEKDVEQRVCPSCGEERNRPTDHFCSSCGVEIINVGVTRPLYLIKESSNLHTFQAESQIAPLNLRHPNIVAVHDAFTDTPYGNEQRGYIVIENVDAKPASQVAGQQEESTILEWGIQLADALAYLHQNHVVHSRVRPENIVVATDGARLTNFNVASVIPEAGWQTVAPKRYAEDVQGLVQVLYYLLTGSEQVGAISVPPPWARILNKVVGPEEQRYQTARDLAADLKAMADEGQHLKSVGWRVGRWTHVGRVRTLNEDSVLTLELSQMRQSVNEPVGVYIVADGMGGHQGGEVASAIAIQTVASRVMEVALTCALSDEPSTAQNVEGLLKEAIQQANQRIREKGQAAGSDMGTTVVVAIIVGDTAYLANVGDSRIYLLDDRSIQQVTTDHSLIQRLIDTGQITAQEAKNHPQRSAVYRVLGDKPRVEVDTSVHRLKCGQRLLLCSDGLNGFVDDDRIHHLVVTNPDPQLACQALVEAANAAGGGDNISVILLQIEAMES